MLGYCLCFKPDKKTAAHVLTFSLPERPKPSLCYFTLKNIAATVRTLLIIIYTVHVHVYMSI